MSKKPTDSKKKIKYIKSTKGNGDNDNPSWYHYLIIIFILVFLSGLVYFLVSVILVNDDAIENKVIFYPYPFKVGNITYNIMFRHPVDDLQNNISNIPEVKIPFLNTVKVIFSFDEYEIKDNAKVTIAGVQLAEFVKKVLYVSVAVNKTENIDCYNATKLNKVITFNPYSNSNVVYWENPYCLRINATDSDNLIFLSNQVMYKVTTE